MHSVSFVLAYVLNFRQVNKKLHLVVWNTVFVSQELQQTVTLKSALPLSDVAPSVPSKILWE